MTVFELRLGLATFLLLSAGLAGNLLLFQGGQHTKPHSRPLLELSAATTATAGATPPASPAASPARPLAKTAATAPMAEPRSEFGDSDSTETIKAIQRELQLKGYPSGNPDGVAGLMTRAAIMAYEHDHYLVLTGEASDRLLKALLLGLPPADKAGARAEPRPGAQSVIRTVQQTLSALGYNPGKVDGRLGDDTVRAIRDFETDNALPETGRISGGLITRLSRAAGNGRLPGR